MINLIIDNQFYLTEKRPLKFIEALTLIFPFLLKLKFKDKYDPAVNSEGLAKAIAGSDGFKAVYKLDTSETPVNVKIKSLFDIRYYSKFGLLIVSNEDFFFEFNLFDKLIVLFNKKTGNTLRTSVGSLTDIKRILIENLSPKKKDTKASDLPESKTEDNTKAEEVKQPADIATEVKAPKEPKKRSSKSKAAAVSTVSIRDTKQAPVVETEDTSTLVKSYNLPEVDEVLPTLEEEFANSDLFATTGAAC